MKLTTTRIILSALVALSCGLSSCTAARASHVATRPPTPRASADVDAANDGFYNPQRDWGLVSTE